MCKCCKAVVSSLPSSTSKVAQMAKLQDKIGYTMYGIRVYSTMSSTLLSST